MSSNNPKPKLKRNILIAAVTAGALAISGVAIARPGGPGGGPGFPGRGIMRLLERLDLTEQQEVQAVRMRRTMRDQRKAMRTEMRASMEEVIAELDKANPDRAKLHNLVDQAAQRMRKVGHTAVDQFLELHSTLTPEQRKILAEEAKAFHERRDQRKGRRGFGRGPGR